MKLPWISLTLLVLLCLGPAVAGPDDEGWTPWNGRLPGEHSAESPDGRWFVFAGQVLDAETGLPVVGARVRVFSERGFVVLDGRGTLVGEGVSDEDGFATLGVWTFPSPSHWLVEAEGYAPLVEFASSDGAERPGPLLFLERGSEVRGRVLDPLGRPRPGVSVSLFEGCGHAPATRRRVTDSKGRFLFPSANLERIWIEGGGVAAAYAEWSRDASGDILVVAPPEVVLTGRVLGPRGEPLAGIWVRNGIYRGPGVRTDAEGGFRLPGVEAGGETGLSTDHAPHTNGVVLLARGPDASRDPRPLRLRFDPETAEILPPPVLHDVELDLGPEAAGSTVTFVHHGSGWSSNDSYEGGAATFSLRPGRHEVRVGSPLGRTWWRPFVVDVRGPGPLTVPGRPAIEVPRGKLTIRVGGLLPPDRPEDLDLVAEGPEDWFGPLRLSLHTADGDRRDVSAAVFRGEPVPVPYDTPLALHVKGSHRPFAILPLAPVPAGVPGPAHRTVRLPSPPRIRLTVPLVYDVEPVVLTFLDAEGGEIDLGWACSWTTGEGSIEALVPAGARSLLLTARETGEFALVPLPDALEPDVVTDLGRVELEFLRDVEVRVRDDRGREVRRAAISFLDGVGYSRVSGARYGLPGGPAHELEEDGTAEIPQARPVRRIRVQADDLHPLVVPARGYGPFEVVVPSGSVTIRGAGRGAVDGRPLFCDEDAGVLRLRGLTPGPHRIRLVLPDGRHFTRTIVLAAGEAAVLTAP